MPGKVKLGKGVTKISWRLFSHESLWRPDIWKHKFFPGGGMADIADI
jgi:hypothetical protein